MLRLGITERLEALNAASPNATPKTPKWLSEETGLAYATVWDYAKGTKRRITFDILEKLATVLGCEPGELLVKVVKAKTNGRKKR